MDSKASPSLSTHEMAPSSPKAATEIKPPVSPSSSLPAIRNPSSTDDSSEGEEENGVEKQSKSSSESDSFHSGGEDEFDNASERDFVADPDEETLEKTVSVVESEPGLSQPTKEPMPMPIAQATGEAEDDAIDADGSGFLTADGVQSVLLSGSFEAGEIGKPGIGVFGGEGGGKDPFPSFEGNSSTEKSVGDSNSIEKNDIRDLSVEEEELLNPSDGSAAVRETAEDDSNSKEGNILAKNPAIEKSPDVERQQLEQVESKGSVAEGGETEASSAVGGNSAVGSASEIGAVVVIAENGVSEMQVEDSSVEKTTSLFESGTVLSTETSNLESLKNPGFDVVEPFSTGPKANCNDLADPKHEIVVQKNADLGSGSDEAIPVTEEVAVSEHIGVVTKITEKDDSIDYEESPISVSSAIVETPEHDSQKEPGFENLEANSNEMPHIVATDGDNSISNETFPADAIDSESRGIDNGRYESQTVSSTDEPIESNSNNKVELQPSVVEGLEQLETDKEVSLGSGVTPDGAVTSEPIHEHEISIDDPSQSSISNLSVEENNDDNEVINDEEAEPDDAEDAQRSASGASKIAKQIMRELEQGSSRSRSGFDSSQDYSQRIDGQIVTDSDEEVDTDEEGDGRELFDSAALAALLKAASNAGPDSGIITVNAQDAARFFSTERPAGLGPTVPSLKPLPPRPNRSNIFTPSDLAVVGEADNDDLDDDEKKLQENIQQIRVKFLRVVHRLGHSPEDTVAAQVLYRLALAEGIRRGRHTNRAAILETARKTAMQMETAGADELGFSCNILILGKTGVGKSATINSIFGKEMTPISAFEPATTAVKEITGIVDGVKIRVIDTPGLRSSIMDQSSNRRILSSIKKFTKKCPPDIVLYIDRLDTQTRDFNDLPLLRSISTILGPSIWLNAIVALTHAASAPPDGPNGSPLSYEVFIAQRSHIVQQSIRQAAGDMRLMNPVALVENHPSCRRNREGQQVLPNGQSWRPQLLLLCYSSKILSDANSLLKLQDPSPRNLFGFRARSPPLPYLLSSLLQSRTHPKLSTDMGGENADSDIDLDDLSDSDHDEEDEYDQLPPFKPLKRSQIAKLSKEQRKAYFDEYDYRVKLLQKKQWKEELQRLRESKKKGREGQVDFGYGEMGGEDFDQENGSPAAVPVPLPDMVLPPSFDGDNPAYRYRFLEPTSQLLARPVLDTHGWDHDCGYDGVSLEETLAIANRFPAVVAVQITKDKKEFNIHLDSSLSAKHGENGSTLAGFDIQSVGKQLAYILRGETKFRNFKKNKTAAGVSVTFLGENVATGLKVEDQISIGKRVNLVASTGAVRSQGDVAYGANLEARLRDKEYPIGQDQSTLGLSLMRWRGDLALGANLQSQFSVGRNSKMAVRIGLNNKLSGQITIRTSSSEQLQIALVGLIPLATAIYRTIWQGESYPH